MKLLIFGYRKWMHRVYISSMIRQFSNRGNRGTNYHIPSTNLNDIIAQEFGDKGLITLNKPVAHNALSYSMIKKLLSVLQQWESSINIVVVKGAEKDAFCAGGDVIETSHFAAKKGSEKYGYLIPYFTTYISLLRHIETYKKPYVALISGIVIGGGVGISVLGKYRVATETTLFGMPETSLGLFPGAGCTYLFPRLNGNLGMYLGLTCHRLKGIDVKLAGFATHYVSSSKLPELTEALLAPSDVDVEKILEKYNEQDPAAEFSLCKYSKQIDRCFGGDTIEEIIHRLKEDGSEWAQSVIVTLNKMSPTSLKITIEAFKRGKHMSIMECLDMDLCLVLNMLEETDLDVVEGVRAFLIDKDYKPLWNPRTLDKVTDQYVENFFINVKLNHKSKL